MDTHDKSSVLVAFLLIVYGDVVQNRVFRQFQSVWVSSKIKIQRQTNIFFAHKRAPVGFTQLNFDNIMKTTVLPLQIPPNMLLPNFIVHKPFPEWVIEET